MDKKLIVKILIGIAVLVLGICIGVFTKNFPVLEIERKVSLIETFDILIPGTKMGEGKSPFPRIISNETH